MIDTVLPAISNSVVMQVFLSLLVIFSGFSLALAAHSVSDFGAVANNSSNPAASANTLALQKALVAANTSNTDRVALVPHAHSFYYFWLKIDYLVNVTLQIDGTLLVSNNLSATEWPGTNIGDFASLWFENANGLTLTGTGTIDGQGYDWWWHVIITEKDHRPHMLKMVSSKDILITNLHFVNSPQFHLNLEHVMDVIIRNISIHVDVGKQRELFLKSHKWLPLGNSTHGLLSIFKDYIAEPVLKKITERDLPEELEKILEALGVPTFPLNTDGIDPSGRNVLIENVTITNFDDAVAVKPSSGGDPFTNCSQNMTIRNAHVTFGVGMTIGSVPPNDNVNCVRNITFENITFEHPIKTVYIKSNPGDSGTGVIDSITYRHIRSTWPLWYPLWIGPQQQRQPGTAGTGCSFFYPIVKECPTQPRVSITNITLEDVTFEDGITLPGVMLANVSTPYTNFRFNNVTNSGFLSGNFLLDQNYVCENVQGVANGMTNPLPACFKPSH